MEEAEHRLRKEACQKINLRVRMTDIAVLIFYKSLGYGQDEVVSLRKKLESDSIP